MKTSIWDILTGVTLLGVLCLIGFFGIVLMNPGTPLNPMPPNIVAGKQQVATRIVLPSPTATSAELPPTWTPSPLTESTLAPSSTVAATSASSSSGLRPSSTPVPTNTVVVLPTFTPSKTARVGIGGGNCQVVYQDPPDNTTETVGKTFDVRWTIKNTSSTPWRADSIDIRFNNGARMHSGNDLRDMPYDVGPGGMLDLVISMTTPITGGAYTSNWSLVSGNTSVCNFYVSIRAQ